MRERRGDRDRQRQRQKERQTDSRQRHREGERNREREGEIELERELGDNKCIVNDWHAPRRKFNGTHKMSMVKLNSSWIFKNIFPLGGESP